MARRVLAWVLVLLVSGAAVAKKDKDREKEDEGPYKASSFSGLKLREIGPALTSGRISDIAVNPHDRSEWIVAAASGGVWKTTNAGTTWKPVFDDEGSYSIGCVTYDPTNPLIVWVGSGENNSQRSVSYGDGVYKSIDGGETWTNVGLETSEHIGKILVDPRDSNVVWVAAQGPLWNSGGERGLYKTTDGGKTWSAVLEIGENTGVTDIAFDPRNPDVVYAAAYQRRRRTWTLIDGGPESGLHKTGDGGKTWEKLDRGLPSTDLGRIGIAVSPVDPDVVYAIVEAERGESGFFRSIDAGASWHKQSDHVAGSPQYYNEIVADPAEVDRVYSLETWLHVTEDGGRTFERAPNRARHVDDHALWIDPGDTDHLVLGCDGGVYESWDRSATWQFKANLPLTQFYRIQPDNDTPFYNVYGGTQDNFTLGGPSRTTGNNGITNRDWFVTLGGDGFEPQIEPTNPDIVYSQYQYGGLARFDRKSGESIDIQPQVGPDDDPLRWNWDSALIISPHSPTRLYFAAQRIFRSDDRGDSWRPISGDLTRNLDRNQLEVMGRIQKVDAVAKNASTSFFGNVVSLSESSLVEGLLYAGTDDGLVQVREAAGDDWRKVDTFPGVPDMSYVSDLEASLHDADTVFAAFDNHKSGDYAPYLLKSTDRGRRWRSIAGDLPEKGTVYTVAQDHVRPDLLFAGTEYGAFFTVDGGEHWVELEGGLPVIAVRDLEIQRRENDLVLGTFGRGIWILDDYSPLRAVDLDLLEAEATLFPVRRTPMYMPSSPLGLPGKSFQGDGFFSAANPAPGAVFTYYLAEAIETLKKQRQGREKDTAESDEPYAYPTWDELRAEDREEAPAVVLIVTDADGEVVRRLTGPTGAGIHRVTWNLRYPAANPTRLTPRPTWNMFASDPLGPMVVPGTYTVALARRVRGTLTPIGTPQSFEAHPLGLGTLEAADKAALLDFQRKTARLQRAVLGAVQAAGEADTRIEHLMRAIDDTPGADVSLADEVRRLGTRLADLREALSGDRTIARRNEPTPASITSRVDRIVSSQWTSTAPPTRTNRDAYRIAGQLFVTALDDLHELDRGLKALEVRVEAVGGPWTPGRLPKWRPEPID